MAYILFLDESGHDLARCPYEVLAGVAVEDRKIWPIILELHALEKKHFGRRISDGLLELKGRKLLKKKTYRLAGQLAPMAPKLRRDLAESCLQKGIDEKGSATPSVTREELTALAQAKLAFVGDVLETIERRHCPAFASIVDREAGRPAPNFLRKDYAYLFERFFYYLDNSRRRRHQGLIAFDEIEKSQAHILIDQMTRYFRDTAKGRHRCSQIVPEPLFVHSDMSSLIQVADLVAYIIAWGHRFGKMTGDARSELQPLAKRVSRLRYTSSRTVGGRTRNIHSFTHLTDLRPRGKGTR